MIAKEDKRNIKKLMKKEGYWKKQTKNIIDKIEKEKSTIDKYKIDLLGVTVKMKNGKVIKILK